MTKPLGRFPVKFPAKQDFHPIKRLGLVNWWEVEMNQVSKSREKQSSRREIAEELNDYEIKSQKEAHDEQHH